jgi:hypothetical protein
VSTDDHVVRLWDLRAIRARFAGMGLDWDLPSYPPLQEQGKIRP